MNSYLKNRRFSLEKNHIDTSNLLREKILALEQQDRSYQEALDLKTQENLSLLERVRLLESDNLHLLNENRALSQEINFIKSIPPPPPIIKEIPVREIREIPPPILEIPPPKRENMREFSEPIKEMPYEENYPSSLKHDRRSYDDLLDKFERFIEKNERENGRRLKKALFEYSGEVSLSSFALERVLQLFFPNVWEASGVINLSETMKKSK